MIDDLKSLGAKTFYPKFCAGSLDHICNDFVAYVHMHLEHIHSVVVIDAVLVSFVSYFVSRPYKLLVLYLFQVYGLLTARQYKVKNVRKVISKAKKMLSFQVFEHYK